MQNQPYFWHGKCCLNMIIFHDKWSVCNAFETNTCYHPRVGDSYPKWRDNGQMDNWFCKGWLRGKTEASCKSIICNQLFGLFHLSQVFGLCVEGTLWQQYVQIKTSRITAERFSLILCLIQSLMVYNIFRLLIKTIN